jgi:nitrogenase molybdenum-iron protein alpha chain
VISPNPIPPGEGDPVPAALTPQQVREALLAPLPKKSRRKRETQVLVNEKGDAATDEFGRRYALPQIGANTRTLPGIITQRGCTYAGCKGVILGPTRDIVNITHGPIGCGFYSWLTRRNQTSAPNPEDENFITYCFSTDMQDENIIFGGEKKLRQAIQEAYDLFHPKAIAVFSTCPVGLIGDDVHAVAEEMKQKLGINVFGFSCEGYKGVSQSAGHHIANNQVFKHVVGTQERVASKWSINLLGEYNIGGDAFELEEIFKRCGIELVATFSGNSTYDQFAQAHAAKLNCVMCHRSINYVADMIETKYGAPWIKVNFIGAASTAKSLRKIAEYFGDQELIENVERVITEEMPAVFEAQARYRARCEGKRAMLFVGGSRAHHYQDLFEELGMETIAAGYEFAHRDDYEGRQVIPSIKIDADSRNIEELHVSADAQRYDPTLQEHAAERAKSHGYEFKDYDGMMAQMRSGALVIDDINHHESEKLIELLKPDVFCAGIKEKYVIQKMGVPCKQLHSYDYGGPYAGFRGAVNFYVEIDRLVNGSVWGLIKVPWELPDALAADEVVSDTDDSDEQELVSAKQKKSEDA